jgi:hypothetical protein
MKSLINHDDRIELIDRLDKLNHQSQRRWGKMTPHQMVCHLSDSFKAAIGEKYVSPSGNIVHRTLVKWIALRGPLSWPKGFKTRPEMDQEVGGTQPAEFVADVKELRNVMDRFVKAERDFEWARHPVFGEMGEKEWLRWGYLHVDHHLRQFGL